MIKLIFSRILYTLAFFLPPGYSLRPALHRMKGVKRSTNVWISISVHTDELHPEDAKFV